MSVRVNERSEGNLAVFIKAKEMVLYTIRVTSNDKVFPKRYRFSIVNRIQEKAVDILTLLLEANEIYPRTAEEYLQRSKMQRTAMANCRALLSLIELSKEICSFNTKKTEYWSGLVFETRIMTASWCKSDRERFEKRFLK